VQRILEEQSEAIDHIRSLQLAAAMALHNRLGAESPMNCLSDDNFLAMCRGMQEDSIWKPSKILQHVWDERQKAGIGEVVVMPYF
jgi:hypothetical protein